MCRRYFWMAVALLALASCEKPSEQSVSPVLFADEENPWIVQPPYDNLVPATGAPAVIGADFGETRAHIDMNADETLAAWTWKQGDGFRMFARGGNSTQWADFTASADGPSVDFTTSSRLTYDPPYYTLFPGGTNRITTYNGQILVGSSIPAEQVAVAGGIKDGYTVAYATVQNMTDVIHFQKMVSLVRFRMSGDIVSKVRSVTIMGAGAVAGDATLIVASDGTASISDNVHFTSDVTSNSVTLSGNFVAGQDYYMVLWPGTHSRFQMVFSDGGSLSTTKTATNFTFPYGRISDFGTIALGNAFEDEDISYDPIQYMAATAGASKPVSIAVIGDGFTKDQQGDFELLAKSAIDALMNTEPYKSYHSYFNVWILKAASKESGASVTNGSGTVTTLVNSFFGSKWGENSYGDMVADENTVFDFVSQNCPDIQNGTHSINEVPILMIINDTRYGGICHSFSNGKGYGMVPYTYAGGGISWSYPNVTSSTDDPLPEPVTTDVMRANYHQTTNAERDELGRNTGDWRNTVVHEFGGHCFGRLGDEYWQDNQLSYEGGRISSQSWQVPFALNLASDPTAVTWQSDVLEYPLETLVAKDPNYGRIGIFQGGGTKMFGRWRSEKISCMIDNRFYFSTWQRMLIVKRIMSLSGSTFNAASFWEKDVTLDPVRDATSSPVAGVGRRQVREMPLLPPPVLHEE